MEYLKGVLKESGFKLLQEGESEAVFKGCRDQIIIYMKLIKNKEKEPFAMVIREDDYSLTCSIYLEDKNSDIGGDLLETIRKVWEKK